MRDVGAVYAASTLAVLAAVCQPSVAGTLTGKADHALLSPISQDCPQLTPRASFCRIHKHLLFSFYKPFSQHHPLP